MALKRRIIPKPPSLARRAFICDPALVKVLRVLTEAGGEARVAGGAVRNALLGEPISDVDVATTLTPDQVIAAAERAGLGVKPTGIDHGTVMLISNRIPYEVTTLRVDQETFGRKARVSFTDDWEADARRRDFTMNALFCDAQGTVHDFVDGYRDILHHRVRFVGDPRTRIKEDYLRILRFFRFHARYGRGMPYREGLAACIELRDGLTRLSRERIRQELLKLLVAPRAVGTVAVMEKAKILEVILPAPFAVADLRRFQAIEAHHEFAPDPILRLHVLVPHAHDLGSRLRLSNEESEYIARLRGATQLSPALRDSERRAILYNLGVETWRGAVKANWARTHAGIRGRGWRELHDLANRWRIPKFPVTGKDLIAAGLKPGTEMGATLRRLEDWWIASDFEPEKGELLAQLKS